VSKGGANRQRIIAAAKDLFYRHGYATTSFTDIARLANIPRGNFYYYFKSKDEILGDVIRARRESLNDQFKQWDLTIPSARQRLLSFISMPLKESENLVRYGCPLGSLIFEMSKSNSQHSAQATSLFDCVIRWLSAQLSELGYAEESRKMAMHLFACLQGATILCNAYRDSSCLHYEINRLKAWIESL
jgi:TetR/AcrR family transcriptional repressor of nem operon